MDLVEMARMDPAFGVHYNEARFRKSSPPSFQEIAAGYGMIEKGRFGNFFKPKTDYGVKVRNSPARRLGTAALAGTLALGGGAGAVKAAPGVAHGVGSAGSSVARTVGDKVDDVRYWGSSRDWRDAAQGLRQDAARTGRPQSISTMSRDDWISAGRPGSAPGGTVRFYRDDRTGVRTYLPNGGTRFTPKTPDEWAGGKSAERMLSKAAGLPPAWRASLRNGMDPGFGGHFDPPTNLRMKAYHAGRKAAREQSESRRMMARGDIAGSFRMADQAAETRDAGRAVRAGGRDLRPIYDEAMRSRGMTPGTQYR